MGKTSDFHEFELESWQRAAAVYDAAWSGLTTAFVPHLIEAVSLKPGARLLDVACGPGYVAEAARSVGADAVGVDFSTEMIRVARSRCPGVEFHVGDAHTLDFDGGSFDAVAMNFGLHHLAKPEAALAEILRVLRTGGRFAFTIWAPAEISPGVRIMEEAIESQAKLDVELPEGPDHFVYSNEDDCRDALSKVGFPADSLAFRTVTVEWEVPSGSFLLEVERDAGVRTSALLRAQEPGVLAAIEERLEDSIRPFARGDGFAIPVAAYVVRVTG